MIAAAVQMDAGAARSAGLVPSINNCIKQVGELISIDKLEARCTRLRKNLGVAAKWLSQSQTRAFMVTLTYRDGVEWQPEHVSDAIKRLRTWLKRTHKTSLRYVWVMENKERQTGAEVGRVRPHYHLILWMPVSVSKSDLMLDERGYWPHGMTNVEKAKAAVRYVMKYASKFDNAGAFPKGARCYGIGGMGDVGGSCRRWINWPSFVQARASVADSYQRQVGGGWTNRASGEWFPSEYGRVLSTRATTVIVRLHDHGRPLDAAGPFNWLPNPGGVAAPGYLH